MPIPMGRRRQHDHDLPPLMHRRAGRYYYGRNDVALGPDFAAALRRYAELHTGQHEPGTFAEAANEYQKHELPKKAPKTQAEYERQLGVLRGVFGRFRLDQIRPVHVAEFMAERGIKRTDAKGKVHGGAIVATREKALLSAVLSFARARGLLDGANPCAGIRGTKSHRDRAVTHDELAAAVARADPTLAGFLELCYFTGQRPGDVVRMRRQDVQDGALGVRQGKTGAKVRITIVGPLEAVLTRLTSGAVGSMFLVRDKRGQPLTLSALRKRFDKLGCDWQIRDLRAKAATDSPDARAAQRLLGHAAASTTDGYIRRRVGERVAPVMRGIAGEPSRIAGTVPGDKGGNDA